MSVINSSFNSGNKILRGEKHIKILTRDLEGGGGVKQIRLARSRRHYGAYADDPSPYLFINLDQHIVQMQLISAMSQKMDDKFG